MVDYRSHGSGDLNRTGGELLHARMGVTSHDAKSCLGNLREDQWPDFLTEEFDAIDIWFPVHRSGENNQRRGRTSSRVVLILAQINSRGNHADMRGIYHATHRLTVCFRNRDYMMKTAALFGFE